MDTKVESICVYRHSENRQRFCFSPQKSILLLLVKTF